MIAVLDQQASKGAYGSQSGLSSRVCLGRVRWLGLLTRSSLRRLRRLEICGEIASGAPSMGLCMCWKTSLRRRGNAMDLAVWARWALAGLNAPLSTENPLQPIHPPITATSEHLFGIARARHHSSLSVAYRPLPNPVDLSFTHRRTNRLFDYFHLHTLWS